MARRLETDEGYWPGFVDALSTIVMVVTFIIIILGIAIFGISTQISKAISDSRDQTERDNTQLAASRQDLEQQSLKLELEVSETQQALQQAVLRAQQAEAALDRQKKIVVEMQRVASPVTQDTDIDADNTQKIASVQVPIAPTEVQVTAEDATREQRPVEVTSAAEVLTVRFAPESVDIDDKAASQVRAFLDTNRQALEAHRITFWSFYDDKSLSQTQTKRVAYFRLMAVRNLVLDAGFDLAAIDFSLRASDAPEAVETVQLILR